MNEDLSPFRTYRAEVLGRSAHALFLQDVVLSLWSRDHLVRLRDVADLDDVAVKIVLAFQASVWRRGDTDSELAHLVDLIYELRAGSDSPA